MPTLNLLSFAKKPGICHIAEWANLRCESVVLDGYRAFVGKNQIAFHDIVTVCLNKAFQVGQICSLVCLRF